MTSDTPKKGRAQKASAEAKGATETPETTNAVAPSAGGVWGLASLAQIRLAAGVALGLSILAVVLALTTPIWSPVLYGNASSARILALGVAQLRPVLESDGPFGVELSTLRRIAAGDAEVMKALEAISADSGVGVPTVAQLQVRFGRTASEIALSDYLDSHRSWLDRSMVSVASALDLHGWLNKMREKHPPTEEIVMQAQAAVSAGDLAAAVDQLGRLTGRPAEIAEPWIRAAKARMAASRVLKYLDTVAATRLSGSSLRLAFNS